MVKVVAAVLVRDNKVLIAKRKEGSFIKDLWEFPGGKVKPAETPEQALVRELHEEFGIEATVGELVGVSRYMYPHMSVELTAYKATYVSGSFKTTVHNDTQWVGAGEMDDFDFAHADMRIVDLVKAKAAALGIKV
jgi:8-oxo-dGTP diphosphatase